MKLMKRVKEIIAKFFMTISVVFVISGLLLTLLESLKYFDLRKIDILRYHLTEAVLVPLLFLFIGVLSYLLYLLLSGTNDWKYHIQKINRNNNSNSIPNRKINTQDSEDKKVQYNNENISSLSNKN